MNLAEDERNHRWSRSTIAERLGAKPATAFPCTEILFKMEDKQRFFNSGEKQKANIDLSIWDTDKGKLELYIGTHLPYMKIELGL